MNYSYNIRQSSEELLPPDKRKDGNKSLIWSLLTPLQWIRDLWFGSYYDGATAPDYVAGTYQFMDQVVYNKKVYMSLIDNNTDAPTSANWLLIQDDFIGLKERILYNGNKLVFEYVLNKKFGTTFRQPNDTPDIYITNLSSVSDGFLIGQTEPYSAAVGETLSTGSGTSSGYVGGSFTFVYKTHFQIHIPVALAGQTNAIRDYANKFVAASLKFIIITY